MNVTEPGFTEAVAKLHELPAAQVGWVLVNSITSAVGAHERGDEELARTRVETCAMLVAVLADKLGSNTAKGTVFENKVKSATE